jgi:outer membrane protein assembly factor BamE (lipoprotein component of BamABCDE complex)
MRTLFPVVAVLLFFLSAGCAHLTGEAKRTEIAEETLKFIKVESTTKQDVLLRLGEPLKVWRGEANFLYADFTKDGIPLGPGIGVPVSQNLYLLLIEFDDNNRVKKFEVKKKSLPGTITTKSNVYYHRRALLEQLSRWVNQVVGSY